MPAVDPIDLSILKDPFVFQRFFWPEVRFYAKQVEVIESVRDNPETFVVAGNMLGKDFIAGFICLWFFMSRDPVRVVTTSVKDDHLRVLWGEIERFVQTSRFPLDSKKGGPLLCNHREIRKHNPSARGGISYLIGMVSERGEGMAGHHALHTLGIIDEASGVDDLVYTQMGTWAKRILAFGNPNPSEKFFRKNVDAGDLYIPA